MFKKTSFIKQKLRALSLKVFNFIENNGNPNFDKNGEKVFINSLLDSFKNVDGKKIIFDIGANIGEYSQMIKDHSELLKLNIELHLFEPTQSCFITISEKFKNDPNVILNNFGVSDSNTTSKIYYDQEKSGLASIYQRNLDSYNIKLNQSEDILLKRMDEYIEKKGIQHIDFIKIDIEGHELNAFKGFGSYINSSFIDYIQFEYGGANLDSHSSLMEIYKFFEDRGFSVAKIMANGLELRNYKPFMDNFMYSNYVAISNKLLKR